MADRDFEILTLYCQHRPAFYTHQGHASRLGGWNGSYHSASLQKCVQWSYAECLKSGRILRKDTIIPEPRLTEEAKGAFFLDH